MAAQKKSPTAKAAEKAEDPSVRAQRGMSAYPEGTHPPVAPSDASWGPGRFEYRDLPADEKPDESTVAQELTADKLEDDKQAALDDAAAVASEDSDA